MSTASELATLLIKPYEQCQRKLVRGMIGPYLDDANVPTIGWGNTQWQDGREVAMSDAPITQAAADALFVYWLHKFADRVARFVPGANDHQVAAFISLAYNIGLTAFSHSSALSLYLIGNMKGAGDHIEFWNEAKGRIMKGLQRRRRAEHLVFDGMAPPVAIFQALKDFS